MEENYPFIINKGLLYGISKNDSYYTEIYNLNYKNISNFNTSNLFGNIVSEIFFFKEVSDDTNYNIFSKK